MIRACVIATAILALGACEPLVRSPGQKAELPPPEEQPGPAPERPPADPIDAAPEPRRATIDWNSARADYAAAQAENPDAGVEIASGSDAPPVPVLLPGNAVSAASGPDGLQFRPLNDGYFAVIKGETYDMLINGTDRIGPTPPGAAQMEEGSARFEETMTGAQVSFKRYGASYLVEFACKDPATAIKGACVTEEEAMLVIEDMLIAGTR